MPAGAVVPMVIASQAADELVRRGLVDEALFARVVEARPDLAEAAGQKAVSIITGTGSPITATGIKHRITIYHIILTEQQSPCCFLFAPVQKK